MAINFPDIDPVIINVWGPFSITWYSLAYVAGILIGWKYFKYLNDKFQLKIGAKFIDDLIMISVIGIILGGRLGYVLFYNFESYLNNPIEILYTWHGGMSFHGGLLGMAFSILIASKIYNLKFFLITDLIACIAPIGIFFGRIANFINGELYGRATTMPFGVIFPNGGPLPLHPSQLYEAVTEGLLIFIVQTILIFKTNIINIHGRLTGLFLIQYGIYRIIIEFFRQPDANIGFFGLFTLGQILSLPLIIFGLIIISKKQIKT